MIKGFTYLTRRFAISIGCCTTVAAAVFGLPVDNELKVMRNPALAITTFQPAKSHDVKIRWRLASHRLNLTPLVVQSFDTIRTALGIRLKVSTSWGSFTRAPVVIVADGKEVGTFRQSWAVNSSWSVTEETFIENAQLVRTIANAQEVYITIVFLGKQEPFDHISFKLSPEQLDDCRLLVRKHDELE